MTVASVAADCGPLAMEATGLSKDFRLGRGATLHAVRDVSFGLYRGAVVALVGESGSGKSTVARLLAGQERPSAGTITLDGQPADVGSRGAFRRYKSEVQLVFQDPFSSLNPVHTVSYHLERPVRLHQGSTVNVKSQVTALLEQVRLTPAVQLLPPRVRNVWLSSSHKLNTFTLGRNSARAMRWPLAARSTPKPASRRSGRLHQEEHHGRRRANQEPRCAPATPLPIDPAARRLRRNR